MHLNNDESTPEGSRYCHTAESMPLAAAPLVAGSYEDGYSSVHQNVTVWRKKNVLRKSQLERCSLFDHHVICLSRETCSSAFGGFVNRTVRWNQRGARKLNKAP